MKFRKEKTINKRSSYIDGEEFIFTTPEDIFEIQTKIRGEYPNGWSGTSWDAWPKKCKVIRKIGKWELVKISLKNQPLSEVGFFKEEKNKEWFSFAVFNSIHHFDLNAISLHYSSESKLEVYKKYFPDNHIVETDGLYGECLIDGKAWYKHTEEIEKLLPDMTKTIGRVFGNSHNAIRWKPPTYLHYEEILDFKINLEWYRKKIQSMQNSKRKFLLKKEIENSGLSTEQFKRKKLEEDIILKKIKKTKSLIKFSGDIRKSKNFLEDFINRTSKCEEISLDWFSDNLRDLRELTRKMSHYKKHCKK